MGALLVAIVLGRQFFRWERLVFVMVGISLLMLGLPFVTGHGRAADWSVIGHDLAVPGVHGGLSTTAMIFIIGIVGTTIAPWQLFFQQGSVVDKSIGTRFTNYERADTFLGSIFTNLQGAALVIIGAMAFIGTRMFGGQANALQLARGVAGNVAPVLGTLFGIVLLNAAMIGAATVTLASSYAIGDLFGMTSTLNAKFRDAKAFYISYVVSIALAGGVVLLPRLPLGLINLGVQVLAGILLPSALGFLVLLCNDRELLGPWRNSPWLNVLSTLIVGLLLQLSLVLTVGTVWPTVNVMAVAVVTGVPVVVVTAVVAAIQRVRVGRWRGDPVERARRADWVTPPDVLERKLARSVGRSAVLGVMRVYLVVAMVLMVESFVHLAHG